MLLNRSKGPVSLNPIIVLIVGVTLLLSVLFYLSHTKFHRKAVEIMWKALPGKEAPLW